MQQSVCREIGRTSAFLLIRTLLDKLIAQSLTSVEITAARVQQHVIERVQKLRPDLLPLMSITNSVLSLSFVETAEAAVLDGMIECVRICC